MIKARLKAEARALVAGARFMTRLPIPSLSSEVGWQVDLARSVRYFPVIGGLIGLLTGLVFWLLCSIVPPALAAALALAVEALVTGAFHEDALADFCDAFGGGQTPEQVREILKDSRIGAYGATGLVLGLLTRWTALSLLPATFAIAASLAAGAIARGVVVLAMRLLAPAADRPSLSRDVGARPNARSTIAAAAGMVALCLPALVLAPAHTVLAMALALLPTAYAVRTMKRVLGGVVGDGLGAIAFMAQTLALAAYAVRF